jgi:hypothetical protein
MIIGLTSHFYLRKYHASFFRKVCHRRPLHLGLRHLLFL